MGGDLRGDCSASGTAGRRPVGATSRCGFQRPGDWTRQSRSLCSRVPTLHRHAKCIVLQAVHLMLDGGPEQPKNEGESPGSSSVSIGRNLDRGVLLAGLCSCVNPYPPPPHGGRSPDDSSRWQES